MRELKHHEKKLLRKTKFFAPWKNESSAREAEVIRKYQLRRREDYAKYNRIVGQITKVVSLLKSLKPDDQFRIKLTEQLTDRLYSLGVVNQRNSLEHCAHTTVSAFCRRRLPVILTSNKWCENIKEATQLIEQGHFQVGPDSVTDPNLLMTRVMEDHISWNDSSKIKRKIMTYKGTLDDYELYA